MAARWVQLSELLGAERDAAIEAAEFSRFAPEVLAKVEALEASALPPALGALLGAPTEEALADFDDRARAFSAGVADAIAREGRLERQRPIERRMVAALRDEVEHELAARTPALARDFKPELAVRLRSPARPARRFRMPRALLRVELWAAAASLALVVWLGPQKPEPVSAPSAPPGLVQLEDMSFEGTATVFETPGATLIWLAESNPTS